MYYNGGYYYLFYSNGMFTKEGKRKIKAKKIRKRKESECDFI